MTIKTLAYPDCVPGEYCDQVHLRPENRWADRCRDHVSEDKFKRVAVLCCDSYCLGVLVMHFVHIAVNFFTV